MVWMIIPLQGSLLMTTEKTSTTKTPSSQSSTPQTLSTDYTMTHQSVVPRGQPRALPIPPRPLPAPQASILETLSSNYSVSHSLVIPKSTSIPKTTVPQHTLPSGHEEIEEALNPFLGAKRLPTGAVTLGSFLGQGAFGQVYRGEWGIRPVALKKIDMEQAKKNFSGHK